jgi:CheY-like chemotaxis protein
MTLAKLSASLPRRKSKTDSGLSLANLNILVLDDEPIIEMWLTETLREAGATVHGANRGADALALIDRHPDIQLLLADVPLAGHERRGSGR